MNDRPTRCACGRLAVDAVAVPLGAYLLLIPFCSDHRPHSDARRAWMIRVVLLDLRSALNEAATLAGAA